MEICVHFAIQFLAISIQYAYVERTEIVEEALVHQFIVDRKVVDLRRIGWMEIIFEDYQIQAIYFKAGNTLDKYRIAHTLDEYIEQFGSISQIETYFTSSSNKHLLGMNSDAVAILCMYSELSILLIFSV